MDREEALAIIRRGNPRERLDAARLLRRQAKAIDAEDLRLALLRENVSWIRAALEDALASVVHPMVGTDRVPETTDVDSEGIFAQAIEETTGRLVHELMPRLGAARLYAELEVEGFGSTKLRRELDRLQAMLDAIRTLGKAASAPSLTEFDVAEVARDVKEQVEMESGPSIELGGPDPLVVLSDRVLFQLILRSALTNAVEATLLLPTQPRPVVLTWDETDREYWVVVLDRGIGLPPTTEQMFEIGATTKKGHLGMGLVLAKRAASSLGGDIELSPRKGGGVRFECRWPRPTGVGS